MATPSAPAYESFGKELKRIRTVAKRSLDDVSQAVELDPAEFGRLETGHLRPSQEIVNLLITHFDLAVSTASRLWRLAGYDQQLSFASSESESIEDGDDDGFESVLASEAKQAFLAISDSRIVYTDMVNVRANNYGLTINFFQGLSQETQPAPVARVGMSLEHAARLAQSLNETIAQFSRGPAKDQPATDVDPARPDQPSQS